MEDSRPLVPLSRLVESDTPITYGVVKPGDHDADGVRFIRSGDIAGGKILAEQLRTISRPVSAQYKRTLLRGGEILVSLVGNPGQTAIVPDDLEGANIARQVGLIRIDKSRADTRYVRYFLSSSAGKRAMGSYTMGSVQQVINLGDLKKIEIPLPDLSEQRAIASVLGTLDDKIELNRKTNTSLEAMARALYQSWFVDFDPVHAKAEGDQSALALEIAALFPESFQQVQNRKIPVGWSIKPVADLADVLGGGTPSTSESSYWDGPFAWVTPKDLAGLTTPVLLSTQRTITQGGLSKVSSGLLPIGTVLLSSRAPIGYLAVAECPVAINQGFIAMKARQGISNLFLLHWAASAHEEIVGRANGSTFLEISKTNFRPIPVVAPPHPVMKAFDELVRPLHERLVLSERESLALSSLRDAVLPRLISGELRVTDAKRIAEKST